MKITVTNNNQIGKVTFGKITRVGTISANDIVDIGPEVYDKVNAVYAQANAAYASANAAANTVAVYANDTIVITKANINFNNSSSLNVAVTPNNITQRANVSFAVNTNPLVLRAGDTMTGNLNVAATIISQNIVPNLNVTYDLGTSTKRFKDLYLSGNSLYLGDTIISSADGELRSNVFNAAVAVLVQGESLLPKINAAYNQANTGRLEANSTFATINATFANVNTTFATLNTSAGSQNTAITNAHNQANTAYAQANAARLQANTARSDANTTFATINTTFATLNTSAGSQNTAITNAHNQANAAYAEANIKLNLTGGVLSGDLTVAGNLIVSGNSTTLNTEILVVEDADIVLLSNVTSTPALNAGVIINRGTSPNTFLRWNESTDKWGWSDDGSAFYSFDTALNAYAQANAARDQANTARSDANTTFATINTTFGTVNTTFGTVNTAVTNAHNQANAAYAQANAAYAEANVKVNIAGGSITGTLNVASLNVNANASIYETLFVNTSITTGTILGVNTIYASTLSSNGVNVTAQAASAYDQANAAYAQANAARSDANTTFATINTTFGTINTTFGSVNTAITNAHNQANDAYTQANAARSDANTTFATINTTFGTINTTFGTVNTAITNAHNQANNAYDTANLVYLPSVTRLAVTSNAAVGYQFDQYGSGVNNPNVYVRAGETLAFSLDTPGHPFNIRVSNGGAAYNTGLYHVASNGAAFLGANAQGKTSGTLYWKVPFGLAGNVYVYQCSVHSGMVGNVIIEYDSTVIHAQANAARDQANTARTTANDAYAQANTARGQANTARDQANTAYDQANTAYGQANNAYAQANLAYAQANTGYAQANDAYAQANAGYAQANTARATANDAYAQANAAYAQANTGRQDANTTFANINLTFATINSTFGTVNTAVTNAHNQANAAYGQANDAYAQANTARDQANTARDTANAAYSQANTGYAQANAAYAQANAARDQANTGYAQANTARDTANAAYLQANTARDTANDAYGQANAARSQANTAYAQANAAYNDSNTRVLRAGDTMTGNLNVASTIITQNVIPNLNVTYNIGSTDNRYVAVHTSKIKLGDALLEANGTALSVDGVVIQGTNVIVNITDSYNQANAARAQANTAYDQANAAYAQANAARSDANTTFATINTTFGSVNTAITNAHNQANAARSQANAAYAQANAAYAEANLKLNLTGGTINGSLNISGNLVITGNTTFVNANSYVVNDPLIFLGANNTISDLLDIGFIGAKNTGSGVTHTGLARDAGDKTWYLFDNLIDSGHENNVVDFANTTLATLRANISANSILLGGNTVATQANLTIAHNQANAAYGQANLAYAQANAARSQANDAYAQANAAYAEANLKFNVAGGAISGNVTVTGDLFVEGNNAVLNVGSVKTENNIIMNSGYVGNNPELQAGGGNAHIIVNRGGGVRPNSMIFYDENAVQWKYYDGQTGEGYIAFDTMQLAYQQANTAMAYANAAANTVHVRVTNQPNGVATAEFSNHKMQLQNTSTVQIDVGTVAYVDGVYANVRFHVLGLNTAHDQANTAYAQANAAYATANNRVLKAGDTMTGNLNVAATITSQNIIPNLNVTYNVGSTTNVYSAIHANTIKLGGATITSNGTALVIDGVEIQGSNVAFDVTASYNQANAARAQANSAYDQANAAYAQANTARSDANTTFATINTTFGTVNTAITNAHNQANAAYAQANAARSDANTTFATINTTFGTINTTFGTVNTAITNAHNQANSAYGQANLAYAQANSARSQANSAYDQANAAYTQANTARSDANTTFATINTTFGTVNTAITNAHNQANTARDTANAAYAQANSNYQPAVTRLDVTTSGASAYLFDQYSGNNPTLYVRAGESLAFSLNTAGHPFMIRTSSGGSNYSNGLTHVSNTGIVTYTSSAQGKESGTLYWKVPYELQGNTYVYQCSVHAGMVGNIVIEPPMVVAYNQANNAYAQANLAYTQANNAYGQANLAYTQANNAYAKANSPITVKEIYVSNSTVVNSYTNINTIQFDSDSGMAVVNAAANTVTIQLNSTFKNWLMNGNTGLVATGLDTVNFIGNGITIEANNNASPKTITFTSSGGGGGSALTIKDEGTSLNTAVTSIDFVGGGVTATTSGSNVTVTIPTGLSNTIVKTTSYTANNAAANLTYTLPIAPVSSAYLFVIKNGIVLTPNTDYTVSNTTLTVKESGAANDVIEVRYFDQLNVYESANTLIEVSSNTVAAQTNTFTLANVTAINRLAITKNGLQLTPNLHYSINTSSNTVTLNTVAEIGDILTFTNFRNVNDIAGGGGLVQYTYNTSTSSIETVDEWSKSTYRSAKYQMQVESGAGYQAVDIMVIHDGVDTNTIQYGSTTFGSNVGVFTSDISGSNVRLRFTATDATSYLTYYKTILASRASESLPTDLMTGSDTYDLLTTLPFHPTDLN